MSEINTCQGLCHCSFDTLPFQEVNAHGADRPILTRRVLSTRESNTCNFIDFTIVPPGSYIGVHTHSNDNEEIYVIVSGHGDMLVDRQHFAVGPGDIVVNRPGGTHGFFNSSTSEVRLVVIEVPVRSRQARLQ